MGWLPVARAVASDDAVEVFAPSPAFRADGVLLATRRPARPWRPSELVVSRDGGLTFAVSDRGLVSVDAPRSLALSPAFDRDGVAVAAGVDGAWITRDGGASWTPALDGRLPGAAAVALDVTGPVLLVAEAGGGLWRSDDGGVSFGLALAEAPVGAVAASGALVAVAAPGGLWTSDDAGATFAFALFPGPVLDLAAGPAGVAVAAGGSGLWRRDPGGAFAPVPAFGGAPVDVELAPGGDVLVIDRDGGAWASTDGGGTFGPLAPGVGAARSARADGQGTWFVGGEGGLAASDDRGRTFRRVELRGPGTIVAVAPSPLFGQDGLAVVDTRGGPYLSTDGGLTFRALRAGLPPGPGADAFLIARPQALLLGPATLAAGDLPDGPFPARSDLPGEGTRFAPRPGFPGDPVVLLGTRAAGAFRSEDAGRTWTRVAGLAGEVTAFAWSADGSVALAAAAGGLYRSGDGGATFAPVVGFPVPDGGAALAAGDDGFVVGRADGLWQSDDGLAFARVGDVTEPVSAVAVATDGEWLVALRGGELLQGPGPDALVRRAGPGGTVAELVPAPSFGGNLTGFLVIGDRLLRTVDHGATWTPADLATLRLEEDAPALVPPSSDLRDNAAASATRFGLWGVDQSAELAFSGVGVAWIGPRTPSLGVTNVELDGRVIATVDQSGAEPVHQQRLFEVTDLPPGPHRLRLLPVSGARAIDALDVARGPLPDLAPPPPPPPPAPHSAEAPTGDTGGAALPGPHPGPRAPACGCAAGASPLPVAAALAAFAARRRRRPL